MIKLKICKEVFSLQFSVFRKIALRKEQNAMKDEKKVKATEEEAKKEVKTEEEGVQLTDEELSSVDAGFFWDPQNHIYTG